MNADNQPDWPVSIRILLLTLILLACDLAAPITPTLTAPKLASTASPTAAPLPTRTPRVGAPAWWDTRLALPRDADFNGDAKRAVWHTRDTNVDGIRDYIWQQATSAGYRVFVITQSQGAIYDLLCVKGQNAFALNLTLGSETTILTGERVGVMHIKITGVANVELDLPMRTRLDVTPGSEISIGASVPNPSATCAQCEYFVNVHIAPFKGVGTYDPKPGIYLIDAQVIPGGDPDKDDYRWAIGGCAVVVKETSGSFDCKQLQNIVEQSKRIDVSGGWTQP